MMKLMMKLPSVRGDFITHNCFLFYLRDSLTKKQRECLWYQRTFAQRKK